MVFPLVLFVCLFRHLFVSKGRERKDLELDKWRSGDNLDLG